MALFGKKAPGDSVPGTPYKRRSTAYVPNGPKEQNTMRFNPKARINTSQVQDRRTGTRYDNMAKKSAGSYNNYSKPLPRQREAPTSYNRKSSNTDTNNRALTDQSLRRNVIKSRMRKAV